MKLSADKNFNARARLYTSFYNETGNFFTVEEIEEIMLRINIICDTNYTIDNL